MRNSAITRWLAALFFVFLLNTAYVAAFASPTIFYMANVLLHLVLGTALAILLLWVLWIDAALRRTMAVAAAFLGLSALLGLHLAVTGNLSTNRWALTAHIATAVLGLAALFLQARRLAHRAGGGWSRFHRAYRIALAILLIVPLAAAVHGRLFPNPDDRIRNPESAPLSMDEEGGGPSSPFFPSSARTNVGGVIPADFFMDSAACGECHKDIYEQWQGSAHRFASFNNQFYRKSVEYMQDVVGTQPSKWCAGCHDHAVFFNGRFERPIREQIDTPEAHAGLACTSCHSIVRVDGSMGNGGFTIEYPPLHELATSRNRYIRALDRFLTRLDPEPHRKTFMKPFMRLDSAEYCSACHKVHLDGPVNSYRWFRGFNEYDNWQASGVSGQGARSFYYPPKPATCVDCHMPLVESQDPGHHDGKVHSHRFPGANTALPFVNRDEAQMKATLDFLQSGFVTVDIFAVAPVDDRTDRAPMVRRADTSPAIMTSFAVGEEAESAGPVVIREIGEISAPIDRAQPRLVPGTTVRVDVVVRTRTIGHFFPGGTVDAFDVWLELQGADADGRIFFWSGKVLEDGRGPVEPGAHFYRSLMLDAEGNPIDKRNAWQARSLLYVRLIPPGAADVAHYRVRIPGNARGPLTLTARLNYRKFSHYYTRFAYAGEPQPGQDASLLSAHHNGLEYSFDPANIPANVSGSLKGAIPDLPIVTLARAEARLQLGTGTDWTPVVLAKDRERWNDWGIGLLLQGDLKGAEYAFQRVTQADPSYADGWLNMARAFIQEGEVAAARRYVQRALELDPGLARTHFFKAMVEKAEGDYEAALRSLRIAESMYPRDRVVLNQMGRILFLRRDYAEAARVLQRVARIDPEDLQMQYTMMLAYRGLGDDEKAARSEALFRRFKAEEAAQAITARRRRISPEDNNERQRIHDHESIPLP